MARGGSALRRGAISWLVALLLTAGVAAAASIPSDTAPVVPVPSDLAATAGKARPNGPAAGAGAAAARPGATPAPIATAAAAPAPTAAATLPAEPLQAAVDAYLAAHPGLGKVTVGVAVAEPGGPVWFGGNHLAAEEPYGILSITKTFTEALVLRQAAAGRIDLDAPMPQLPGVVAPPAGVVITPRMLLQHTSGVVNYMSAVGYDAKATVTPQQLVSWSLKSPLLAAPGTKASYSNTNFHWLGLLLEHVTGRSYADLVQGLAVEAGLHDTAVDPAGRPGWIGYASGGVRSSVGDVTRWGAALFTPGRVLGAESVADLTRLGPLGVSLGLWPVAGGVGQLVAHGGIVHFPAQRLVVVVRVDPGTAETNSHTTALASAVRQAFAQD